MKHFRSASSDADVIVCMFVKMLTSFYDWPMLSGRNQWGVFCLTQLKLTYPFPVSCTLNNLLVNNVEAESCQ